MRVRSVRTATPTTTRLSPILRMPNLPDTGALLGSSLDRECPSSADALAVKLVHSPVQAIQCGESNGEHDTVNGKDHQKNIEAVGHRASLLEIRQQAAASDHTRPADE